jgi:hypothetical protein
MRSRYNLKNLRSSIPTDYRSSCGVRIEASRCRHPQWTRHFSPINGGVALALLNSPGKVPKIKVGFGRAAGHGIREVGDRKGKIRDADYSILNEQKRGNKNKNHRNRVLK